MGQRLHSPKNWSDGAEDSWQIKTADNGDTQLKEEFARGMEMTIVALPGTVCVQKSHADYDAAKNQLKDVAAGGMYSLRFTS